MIVLLDKNGERECLMDLCSDVVYEQQLNQIDKLEFKVPVGAYPIEIEKFLLLGSSKSDFIIEQGRPITVLNKFTIKEVNRDGDTFTIFAVGCADDLIGTSYYLYEQVESTLDTNMRKLVYNLGWRWTLLSHPNQSNFHNKKRTIRVEKQNVYEIIKQVAKVYRCDFKIDCYKKQIYMFPSDVGINTNYTAEYYFRDDLNMISLSKESHTHDLITKITAIGKEGLTFADINNGLDYVENYDFTNKVMHMYWEDNRYTDAESLLEDTIANLKELSVPFESYTVKLVNLYELHPDLYSKGYSYELGNIIDIVDSSEEVILKQKIIKITKHPLDPLQDTCVIASLGIKFEDIQVERDMEVKRLGNLINADGTLRIANK